MTGRRTITARDGQTYALRPIQPEDAPALQRAFQKMDLRDRRARLFASKPALSDDEARDFCTVTGPHDVALLFEDPGQPGELLGGLRLMGDPTGKTAEFAVSLRSDMKGRGLGRALMEALLTEARAQGPVEVWGSILADNRAMVELCRKLGFAISHDPDDPMLVKAVWQAPGRSASPD